MQASSRPKIDETGQRPPRIYYVHPMMLSGMTEWTVIFDHAADLGFDTILTAPPFLTMEGESVFMSCDFDRLTPSLDSLGLAQQGLGALAAAARNRGLKLMIDLVVDRM